MADSRRRLAAILAADVVGYSRLMGSDEQGTINALDASRTVFRETIERHHGRVVDTAGDSILAVFESVVEATQCAIVVQKALRERANPTPERQYLQFRIGINLGDVIEKDDGTVYGDGVNVTARLEALAAPGRIAISDSVYAQVHNKLDLNFADLGTHQVKNISAPLHAYAVGDGEPAAKDAAVGEMWTQPGVVVLPFANLGNDPEHEHFADGLTDDIITALAACRSFPVIARNSAFAFKGEAPDFRRLARDLDVGYIVEGSIRRAGPRVRVTAQLISCATGRADWAQRYDRRLEDIFDLQDELTETIVAALEPAIGKAERQKTAINRPQDLDAWQLYQQALSALFQRTRESHQDAKALLGRVVDAAPNFPAAHAALVDAYYYDVTMGLGDDVQHCRDQALDCARRAVAIDPQDPAARCALGKALMVRLDHNAAIPELEAALALNPSMAWAHYGLGASLSFIGRPAEAVPHLEKAIRLSPYDTHIGSFMVRLSDAYLFQENFEAAAEWARKAIRQPNFQWSRHANLLVALGYLERLDEVPRILEEIRKHFPAFSIEFVRKHHLITDQQCMALYLEGLRRSGVGP